MSKRLYAIIAFILAIAATVVGWSQTFAHKTWPATRELLWFPLFGAVHVYDDMMMIVISLIQFPLLAIFFALGIRRWPVAVVCGMLAFFYACLIGIAFVRSR